MREKLVVVAEPRSQFPNTGEHRAFSMLAYVWRRTRDAETSASCILRFPIRPLRGEHVDQNHIHIGPFRGPSTERTGLPACGHEFLQSLVRHLE